MASRRRKPTAAEAMALLLRHAAEAETLEHRAAAGASAVLRLRLQEMSRWLARTWTTDIGPVVHEADPVRLAPVVRELRRKLAGLSTDHSQSLLSWGRRALMLGVQQALVESRSSRALIRHPVMGQDSVLAAFQVAARIKTTLGKADAILLASAGTGYQDVMMGVAAANRAVLDIERAARWITNRELNNGTYQVALSMDAGVLWVAERNACVHCLAYSGVIAEPGNTFPPDLTFGSHPLTPWPNGVLDRPPLHVNCRCRVTPWLGGNTALPDALKREARRSIAKGWSVDSEPNFVRLDAADRLLRKGANLPKTVEEKARQAVRTGHFASRTVPEPVTSPTNDRKG